MSATTKVFLFDTGMGLAAVLLGWFIGWMLHLWTEYKLKQYNKKGS